ncbi:MAG TPA: cupin domain-containing protein [Candidatus Acidoferrales bacterium]|nr:cupin domain-containing protein [Candidatus Acidoferrales bacterium]
MILSKNSDVEARVIKSVEGKVLQGKVVLKPMMMGDQMTLLEIQYSAGAGTPTHVHQHESVVYVVRGKVRMTVGDEEYTLSAGDVCRHPKGVPHSVQGLEDSLVVEIKSPSQPLEQFLGT